MTESERKIKYRVQLITAASMVVFFTLILILTVQLAIMGNQKRLEKSLKAKQIELAQKLASEEDKPDYYSTQRFVDEYALYEYGVGKEGTKIAK